MLNLFLFTCRSLRGWLASWPPVGQQGSFWRWSKTATSLAERYWSLANLAQERLPLLWVRATLEGFQNTISFHRPHLEVTLLPCTDVIGLSYVFVKWRVPAPRCTSRVQVQLRFCVFMQASPSLLAPIHPSLRWLVVRSSPWRWARLKHSAKLLEKPLEWGSSECANAIIVFGNSRRLKWMTIHGAFLLQRRDRDYWGGGGGNPDW